MKYISTHQVFIFHLYKKLFKCFSNYIPNHLIPKTLNEELIDIVIVEIVNMKDFEKSDTEVKTYGSIEELKFPRQHYDWGFIILSDHNEKEMNDPRVQSMFKRSRHNNLSFFIISQDYYELPKKTVRAIRNIYHIFEPNTFVDVRNIYQDEASLDMTLDEFKYSTSTCWNENYEPLTIDMTKDEYTGRYILGLNSSFIPNSNPFQNK